MRQLQGIRISLRRPLRPQMILILRWKLAVGGYNNQVGHNGNVTHHNEVLKANGNNISENGHSNDRHGTVTECRKIQISK